VLLAVGAASYGGWIAPTREPAGTDPSTGTAGPSAEPPRTVPGVTLEEPEDPAQVLTAAGTSGAAPSARGLERQLSAALADPSLGRHVAFAVRDLSDPRAGWAAGRPTVIPASTLKLLTATTALATMGPDHRFRTTVVAGSRPSEVVLVGGGDPLLTDVLPPPAETPYPRPATLRDLARQTAVALGDGRPRTVRLRYDVSLFRGPSVNPTWEPDYLPDDVVSPIVPLWVDEGREVAGFAARSEDPALVAASRFADLLEDSGIRVIGTPTVGRAAPDATELAVVESAPLAEIVQHTLEVSDNEAAEVLLRQSAIALDLPGSFEGGVAAMRTTLGDLGVDLAGATIHDGSGLSRDNRLSVVTIVDVLLLGADPPRPGLEAVLTTLPVAGFTGSLAYRFVVTAPDGLGLVRAKTGTLSRVHGLAGLAVTRDNRPLAFAVVADRVRLVRTLDARAQLDVIASLVADCGC
jgi:D-alanyl-D-alanine carboxypeptidase/D-alanyl-D-alanine-endopeptidase (penicillin-binding protein 4)